MLHKKTIYCIFILGFLSTNNYLHTMETTLTKLKNIEYKLRKIYKTNNLQAFQKLLDTHTNYQAYILSYMLRNPLFEIEKQPELATLALEIVCKHIISMSPETLAEALDLALTMKETKAAVAILHQLGNGLVYGTEESVMYYKIFDSSLEECALTGNNTILQAVFKNQFSIDGARFLKLLTVANKHRQKSTVWLILKHLCENFDITVKNSCQSSQKQLIKWGLKNTSLRKYVLSKNSLTQVLSYIEKHPKYLTKKTNNLTRAIRFDHPTVLSHFLNIDSHIKINSHLIYTVNSGSHKTLWLLYAYYLKNFTEKESPTFLKNLLKTAKNEKLKLVGRSVINCDRIFCDLSFASRKKEYKNFVLRKLPCEISSNILTWAPALTEIVKKNN